MPRPFCASSSRGRAAVNLKVRPRPRNSRKNTGHISSATRPVTLTIRRDPTGQPEWPETRALDRNAFVRLSHEETRRLDPPAGVPLHTSLFRCAAGIVRIFTSRCSSGIPSISSARWSGCFWKTAIKRSSHGPLDEEAEQFSGLHFSKLWAESPIWLRGCVVGGSAEETLSG